MTQALEQCRDLGIRICETAVLNSLGELACRTGDHSRARDCHGAALAIAREIAVPLEAGRALQGLGQARLAAGEFDEGITCLRQALGIYQRIGAPAAQRLQTHLREL